VGNLSYLGAVQEIQLAPGRLMNSLPQRNIVAEPVVPIPQSLGTVSVRGEPFEEVSDVLLAWGVRY